MSVDDMDGKGRVFRLRLQRGALVARFPQSSVHLESLWREARLSGALRAAGLPVPDAWLVTPGPGEWPFALHTLIEGEPLTTELYERTGPHGRSALVWQLASLFVRAHGLPMAAVSSLLGLPWPGEESRARLAAACGKPAWFGPDVRATLARHPRVAGDREVVEIFARTQKEFDDLPVRADYRVFGHGDLHGFNMAIVEGGYAPRLEGVFDLGNAGILDAHEDFFRLSFIGRELVARVVAAYHASGGVVADIRLDRIEVYFRAFLLYLMAGKLSSGDMPNYQGLRCQLLTHVAGRASSGG